MVFDMFEWPETITVPGCEMKTNFVTKDDHSQFVVPVSFRKYGYFSQILNEDDVKLHIIK